MSAVTDVHAHRHTYIGNLGIGSLGSSGHDYSFPQASMIPERPLGGLPSGGLQAACACIMVL
jgi:hypothetical protein